MKKLLIVLGVIGILVVLAVALLTLGQYHTHTFSEEWKSDNLYHRRVCTDPSCGETTETAPHTYGEGVVTSLPTLTSDGETTFTCTVCGHTRSESIVSDTRVTKDEWESILRFENADNLQMVITRTQEANPPVTLVYDVCDNVLSLRATVNDTLQQGVYIVREENAYTGYTYDPASQAWQAAVFTEDDYQRHRQDLSALFAYEKFEYHTTLHTYYNPAPLTVSETMTLTDVTLGIVGDQLVKLQFTDGDGIRIAYEFFYGQADITPPTVTP